MSRSPQSASFLARPGLIRMLALFAVAFPCARLPAQSSAPAPSASQAAPALLPAAPAPAVHFSAARQGLLSTPGSFPFAPGFGSFVPPAGSAIGFTAAPALNSGREGAGGFSPFDSAGKGGRPPSLSPIGYGSAASLAAGAPGPFGPAPGSLSSLNGSLRGNLKLPLAPPASSLRFTYRASPAPSSFFSNLDIRKMINTGMYTSPDLGNGVHFSAGTDYNGKSVAGSRKPPGPSVNIKLTF